MRYYFDHNATSPLRDEARSAAMAALSLCGNASSIHAEGRTARALVEQSRQEIADIFGVSPRQLTFTSGGSEAAATLLTPGLSAAGRAPAERLVVSAIEHSCVLSGGRFAKADISIVPVTGDGIIDLAALEANLENDSRIPLVALMLANNETGVLQPVADAAKIAHAHGGSLVCDAVQAFGKHEIDFDTLGADALFVSGHKIGAMAGIGAIITKSDVHFPSLLRGGGQEADKRAGSENVSAISSFAAAATIAFSQLKDLSKIKTMRDFIEQRVMTISPSCQVVAQNVPRLGNTSCLIMPDRKAETLVIGFDLAGFAIGAGSACTSGKLAPSHVLSAMGFRDEDARSAVRISLGWSTTYQAAEAFCAQWEKLCATNNGSIAA